ncbi:hypothetical protein TeGR_g1224 [Tetraparma gracilis]|uniref:Fungal lipase-type domain-containing protein n=1 Tax=Tetraparma gracilis TaxID=2962635 RepID=A0ABQ6MJE2_9STRA|nr:hypothetical protein TeGR_g1224 [Tetraparma gracilis]
MGASETCGGDSPVCCNSNFASVCCPANSACTQGCRDSLLGSCGCIPLRKSEYDEDDAVHRLAYLAASQCHVNEGLNNTWSCNACTQEDYLEEVNLVENKGHAALVGWDGSAVVVALRGSLSAQDWIDDAKNAVLTDYPECEGCRVGLGWYDTCKDMAELTIAAAREVAANHPGAPLIITGHSLGAAVAPLFYAEVAKTELKEQVQFPVYTFGQPRVGNDVYAKWFEGQIEDAGEWYRVVHNNDPVPHLPPPALGFTHMSTEIYYMESGTGPGFYQVCDGSGEDQQCSAGTLVSGNFNDHNEYIDHDIHQCHAF